MTRDVSNRPRQPSRAARFRRKTIGAERSTRASRNVRRGAKSIGGRGLIIIASLVAVNLGVVVYHGDPRDLVPEVKANEGVKMPAAAAVLAAEPSKTTAAQSVAPSAPPTKLTSSAPLQSQAGSAAAVPPWQGKHLQPLTGVRTPGPVQRVAQQKIAPGQTIGVALLALGIESAAVPAILEALRQKIDFRRLQPGQLVKARFDAQEHVLSVEVHRHALDKVAAEFDAATGTWQSRSVAVPVDTMVASVSGDVSSSLWAAVGKSGEDPKLALEIAEIFAWDIDFYSEVYPGDTFRLLVEKRYIEGKFLDYGQVLAAEFSSAGRVSRAYLHSGENGTSSYYDANGESLRKQLLKSPLKFGHVTSKFGTRRHPVLGYTRAHNGIDYGVPTGTPVWSVGDGRVVKAGWHGGYGKLVEVRHSNGWLSQYAHLSAINVKVGQRVSQKQIVGKVGTTGMSTGPHLHYGLKKAGNYVNPLAQKFERADPLAGAERERFMRQVADLSSQLQEVRVAGQGGRSTSGENAPTDIKPTSAQEG